ncbi:MAG: hypothetical protein ACM3JD_07365 [Rudaea sp.]
MTASSDLRILRAHPTEWRTIIARREFAVAATVSSALVALATLPYLLGYALASPGTEFMGVLMNPEDSNSYLAKMEQGFRGDWLYLIPFTSQPHQPEFLGGFYMALGQLARITGYGVLPLWHLARLVSGLILFLSVFLFIRFFLEDKRQRWFAFLLATTGAGLGWLLFLLGQKEWLGAFPVDFKMPESHLLFAVLTFPHYLVGIALILLSIWLGLRALDTGLFRYGVACGLANLALAIIYPFLIYLVAAVIGLNGIALLWDRIRNGAGASRWRTLPWREGAAVTAAFLVPLPLLLYYAWVLRTNPAFAAWDAQSITLSPNALHYVISHGPMLLLAAPTLRARKWRALWLWVLAAALLIYAPVNPQRRFVEGVQIPLAILATAGLFSDYLPRLAQTRAFRLLASRPNYTVAGLERLLLTVLLLVFAVSNLYVLASTSITAGLEQPYPLFHPAVEVEAVEWAGSNLPERSVVLAAYETGSLIPTRTPLRTVVGHWAETPDFDRLNRQVEHFLDPAASSAWRSEFLRDQRVNYVFVGPRERLKGISFTGWPELQPVYDHAGVVIYRVTP